MECYFVMFVLHSFLMYYPAQYVYDAGPTLAQHKANVLCLLGTYNVCQDIKSEVIIELIVAVGMW